MGSGVVKTDCLNFTRRFGPPRRQGAPVQGARSAAGLSDIGAGSVIGGSEER